MLTASSHNLSIYLWIDQHVNRVIASFVLLKTRTPMVKQMWPDIKTLSHILLLIKSRPFHQQNIFFRIYRYFVSYTLKMNNTKNEDSFSDNSGARFTLNAIEEDYPITPRIVHFPKTRSRRTTTHGSNQNKMSSHQGSPVSTSAILFDFHQNYRTSKEETFTDDKEYCSRSAKTTCKKVR